MPFPWMLVAQIALTVGSIILGRRNVEQGKLDDVNVDTGSYGRELPLVLGEQQVVGQTIWINNNQLIEVKKTKRKPPLIGSKITSYEYYATFAVALTCNKVKLVKVWANDTLIIDMSGTSTGGISSGINYEFKDGSDTQSVSSIMSNPSTTISSSSGGGLFGALFGAIFLSSSSTTYNTGGDAGNTMHPAYNGISYLVFDRLKLEKYGNAIPTIKVQVVEIADVTHEHLDLGQTGGAVATVDNYDRIWLGGGQILRSFSASTGEIVDDINVGIDVGDNFVDSVFYQESSNNILFSSGIISPRLFAANAVTGSITSQSGVGQNGIYWNAFDGTNAIVVDLVGRTSLLDVSAGGIITGEVEEVTFGGLHSEPRAVFGAGYFMGVYEVQNVGYHIGFKDPKNTLYFEKSTADYGFTSGDVHISYHRGLKVFLACGAGLGLAKLDSNGNVLASSAYTDIRPSPAAMKHIYRYAPDTVWLVATNFNLVHMDLRTLEVIREIEITTISGDPLFSIHEVLPAPSANALFVRTSNVFSDRGIIYLDRPPGVNLTVAHCVEQITSRLGISLTAIDATEATRELKGLTVSGDNSRRSLEQLLQVTGYELIEEDGILRVIDRGKAPVMSIDEEALGEANGSARLERNIGRESEIPWKVELSFADFEGDFENNVAIATTARDSVDTNYVMQVDAPFALTVDQAKTYVERLLAQQLRERAGVSFKLPAKRYARLSAGDVVTVPDGNDQLNVRITRIAGVHELEIDGVIDDSTGLSISLSGTARGAPSQTLTQLAGTAAPVVVDSAIPVDEVDALDGVGVSAAPVPTGTDLGVLEYAMSSDGGLNYDELGQAFHAPLARPLKNILGDVVNPAVMDNVNVITIENAPDLQSYSFNEIAENPFLNLCFVQSGTDWELVQFQNVTDNMDGTYTLTGLLRGLRGTEHLTGLHTTADTFVLFNDGYVRGVSVADLGLERKFISVFEDQENPIVATETLTLEALRPYSPVDIEFSQSDADNIITWRRRTRLGGNDLDGNDVPLSETSENYEIDFEDGTKTIVRTLTSTSETVTYTSADQITDLGAEWVPYTAHVYQLSDEYGRGVGASKYFANTNNIILAEITQIAVEVVVSSVNTAPKVTQNIAEVIVSSVNTAPKVTQNIVEVFAASEDDPKVTHVIAEIVTD